MSGGVDSSVAAALLKEQGHEVIGLMMRLWSEPGAHTAQGDPAHNRCCSPDAIANARYVAGMFDIPFYVVDAQEVFRRTIVDFFVDGYVGGVTPNPCMECNRHIRWEFLLNKALSLGATHLATGHYARVRAVDRRDVPAERLQPGDASAGDASAGDVSAGDVSAGDVSAGDVSAGDVSAGDVSAGDASAGDAPAGDAPPERLRQGDASAGDAPAGRLYELLKAMDEKKDQSYVLSVMGQAQLRHAMFPVGEFTKPQIRELARQFNLPVAERPDSQDLCFLADNDYRRFLAEHAPQVVRPGPIVDSSGKVLGRHQGLAFYTIGQRKGIGLAAAEPLYVLTTDPERNALVVGPVTELGQTTMRVGRINWVGDVPPTQPFECTVKIRYKAAERPCTVTPLEGNRAGVALKEPARDVTPGQGAVFYDGDVCLGGGIILK